MPRKPLTADRLFARNLTRIVEADGRSVNEIGLAIGLAKTPGQAGQNLIKYLVGERWPRPAMLDTMAAVLKVARADFFRETA